MATVEERIKREAAKLGFDLSGIGPSSPLPRSAAGFTRWLQADMHGEMRYMARPDRVERTLDPRATLTGAQSAVVVAKNYFTGDLPAHVLADPSRGILASYAWAPDYHDLLLPRLNELADAVRQMLPGASARAYVDTGPFLERDAAVQAGLGFVGKNTMLIRPELGSWLFLGVVLVDRPLAADEPGSGTCGQCERCLNACPTSAFPNPYVLDGRRCISYLTIELKGPIPRPLRKGIGNRIFGCDICNEVCPYNRRFADPTLDPALAPRLEWVAPALLDLVGLDDARFRERFAGSPVIRPRRRGFIRNVCVALGNWGSAEAVQGLAKAIDDSESLIRGHAAWALGQVGSPEAHRLLARRSAQENDPWVLEEIDLALQPRLAS